MQFENKVYDVLKWLCLIALPAFALFFKALDGAFGWGCSETVGTVIDAVAMFIGTLIGISTKSFNALPVYTGENDGCTEQTTIVGFGDANGEQSLS